MEPSKSIEVEYYFHMLQQQQQDHQVVMRPPQLHTKTPPTPPETQKHMGNHFHQHTYNDNNIVEFSTLFWSTHTHTLSLSLSHEAMKAVVVLQSQTVLFCIKNLLPERFEEFAAHLNFQWKRNEREKDRK